MSDYEILFKHRPDRDPFEGCRTVEQMENIHKREMWLLKVEHNSRMAYIRANHPSFKPWWKRFLGL